MGVPSGSASTKFSGCPKRVGRKKQRASSVKARLTIRSKSLAEK